jgi:hypothetical protein
MQEKLGKTYRTIVQLTLVLFVLLSGSLVNAATVVYSSPGVVTAIGDLDIGGTLYNVDFEAVGDVYSTYGGTELFWETGGDTFTAMTAINNVLNTEGYPVVNNGSGPQYVVAALDSLTEHGSANWSFLGFPPFEWDLCSVTGCPDPVGFYGEFSPLAGTAWSLAVTATVPIPAAAWLFGSALGLLGLARRRNLAAR